MNTAIITGASRGFGLAVARLLAQDQWSLVVDARNGEALESAVANLRGAETGAEIIAVPGDVADPAHRRRLLTRAEELGGPDLLINSASELGPSPQPALADYPLDILAEVYRINVLAPLALTQAALPQLRASGGTVVNVTSDAALEAYEGWGGYGSSKAALDQITAILAAEEPQLHVYAFDPGDMRTQMHQLAFPGEDISDRPLPESVAPALIRLVHDAAPSGRYCARDLADVSLP